jgi:hypothetical protein
MQYRAAAGNQRPLGRAQQSGAKLNGEEKFLPYPTQMANPNKFCSL